MVFKKSSLKDGYIISAYKLSFLLVGALLYYLVVTYLPYLNGTEQLQGTCYFMNWVGIFIYITSIWSWRKETGEWLCPYIIFYSFFFLFNYGQCVMWAFGIHADTEGFIYGFGNVSTLQVLKAQVFTCFMMYMFHVGALFCIKHSETKQHQIEEDTRLLKSIYWIGQLLGVIAIPVTLFRAAKQLTISMQYGYYALYYSDFASQGGWMMIVEYFFFPALVCLLIGGKHNKRICGFVYLVFGIYMLLNLLAGDRGSWLVILITLIWLYIKCNNGGRLRFKNALKWLVIGYIGLWGLDAFVELRNIGIQNLSFADYKNAFALKNSPIVSAFFEMGGTMNIITMLLSYGNNIWTYGNSYLLSIIGVVSTRFLTLFGLPFVLIDDWFSQSILGISWGAGFSMIGEAYLNGGLYVGPLYVIILGFIIGSALYINRQTNQFHHPIRYVFVATSLNTLTGFSRGSSYLFLKHWFYGTIIVCLIIYTVYSLLKKSSATKINYIKTLIAEYDQTGSST